jgi:hypothetical protein
LSAWLDRLCDQDIERNRDRILGAIAGDGGEASLAGLRSQTGLSRGQVEWACRKFVSDGALEALEVGPDMSWRLIGSPPRSRRPARAKRKISRRERELCGVERRSPSRSVG